MAAGLPKQRRAGPQIAAVAHEFFEGPLKSPVYIHLPDGTVRGFVCAIVKDTPFEVTLPVKPEKVSLNDKEDILAKIKQ